MDNFSVLLPEIALLFLTCVVLLVDVYRDKNNPLATFWTAVLSLVIVLVLIALNFPEATETAFAESFKSDRMGAYLKLFLIAVVVFSFFYNREYFERKGELVSEYFLLSLFAALGMMLLISANTLLMVYLGLELLSLSLYAMVALDRDSPIGSEAAIKYFVLGALASGILLYGISMIYGLTGELRLEALAISAEADLQEQLLVAFGLVFIVVGIAFKLGVVPFHMWIPDVYHGAATPTTQFIGTAPKLAAFAMAMRLLVDGLGAMVADWQMMLALLAAASMVVGNVVAIAQTNIKRMLAYSTIAHMGFLLLGILSGGADGYAASMFYVLIYAITSLGAFGSIILLSSKDNESDELEDFAGLARRSPWIAFLILILLFSLAGVPPFAGFWAKWFVLKEVIAAGFMWLAIVGILSSLVGAYYYLRVIKLMYFDEPIDTSPISASRDVRTVFSLNSLVILALGLMPGVLMTACLVAVHPYAF